MSGGLALLGAHLRAGQLVRLAGVDVRVPAGRLGFLLGRNGSGRSAVLEALAGLARPAPGAVLLDGRDVTAVPAHRRASALGVVLVPARQAVFPALTVEEHLALAGRRARAELPFAELRPLLRHPAGTLSGGQQQLLALSRALLADPAVLLLDEPERGLAPAVLVRLHTLLLGRTALLTARSLPAWAPPDALVHVLERGRVAWRGEAGELRGPF